MYHLTTWDYEGKPYLRRWLPYDYRRFLLWYLAMSLYVRDLHSPVLPAGNC